MRDPQKGRFNTIDRGIRPPPPKVEEEIFDPPSFPLPEPGQMVEIPAGTFLRGSAPDDVLRSQFAENDNIPTQMHRFFMDALPWPNDPALPPVTGVSRPEAAAMCAQVGKRLCTEVEIEYACKGTENRRYIAGNLYHEAAYAPPLGTPSPFGVWALGTLLEWTDSAWGLEPDQAVRAALRGFVPNRELAGRVVPARAGRRCAQRWWALPETRDSQVGFRCCKGPRNEAACFIERPRPAHSVYKTMKPDEFAAIIRSIPELKAVHDNPHMFSNADIRAVLAKRNTDRKALAKKGIHFIWKPLRWIPRQGMELWLAVGRSNRHSFVVALHEVKDNEQYVHASSLIIWDNPIPLALVYQEGHRDEAYWAPCWGCRDGGAFVYNEETNQVEITHRW